MKLNCSWDDLAFVIGGGPHSRNRDRIVTCDRLATDDEERDLRSLQMDWSGPLWKVDIDLVWVDEQGLDHWLPFVPDIRLRRIDGGTPSRPVEVVAA